MTNPWIEHVKAYSLKHKVSYSVALKQAGKTYKKKKMKGGELLPLRKPGKFPPKSRKLLEQVGNEPITSMRVERAPILEWFNTITFGEFKRQLNKLHYDNVFHLSLVLNEKYRLEKSYVLNFEPYQERPKTQSMDVSLPMDFSKTIQEVIDTTKKEMGPYRFSHYDVVTENCQKFVEAVLSSNGLLTPPLKQFVSQDVSSVIASYPGTDKVIGKFTEWSARLNRLVQGEGQQLLGHLYVHHL